MIAPHQLRLHIPASLLHILDRPPSVPRQQSQSLSLQTFELADEEQLAEGPLLRIRRPRAQRHLDLLVLDALEAGRCQSGREHVLERDGAAGLPGSVDEGLLVLGVQGI